MAWSRKQAGFLLIKKEQIEGQPQESFQKLSHFWFHFIRHILFFRLVIYKRQPPTVSALYLSFITRHSEVAVAGGLDKIVSIPTFFCYPRSDGVDNNPSGSASLKLTACKVLPHFFLFSILGEIRIFLPASPGFLHAVAAWRDRLGACRCEPWSRRRHVESMSG